MMRVATIALVLVVLGAVSVTHAEGPARIGHWQEIAWPFPRDGWPAGRAFRCTAGGCEGAELYVRAKRGFCNCDTGVADDDEVDRVTDVDLISPHFAATAPGEIANVAAMQGRIRHYDLEMPGAVRHAAAGIALSRRCDLLVAVAQGALGAYAVQRAALEFLETQEMKTWMQAALDGR